MSEIAAWNGHSFTVSSNLIRGFTDLTIKGSSETENKTSDGQKYVARKNSKPSEISLIAELIAFTGCDVKTEALKFVDEARSGAKNYFYMGGKKLIACQLMLTDASVSETTIAPNGTWVSCKVLLTMKQCAKYDATGGSGSKKSSVKTTPTTTKKKSYAMGVLGYVTGTIVTRREQGALKAAEDAVNKARAASSTTKNGSIATKMSAGISKVIRLIQ